VLNGRAERFGHFSLGRRKLFDLDQAGCHLTWQPRGVGWRKRRRRFGLITLTENRIAARAVLRLHLSRQQLLQSLKLAKLLLTLNKNGVLMQRTPTITWLSPFYGMMGYLPTRVITL
jgi:hypothetical protein